MKDIGYNASQISSQRELNLKFKKILKILENNVANFDTYEKIRIYPKSTLLRKFISLVDLLKLDLTGFNEYYNSYVVSEMNLTEKFDRIYEFLKDYYGEE